MLKRDHNINVEALNNYRAVDELRLINNAIKHENKLSKPLAKYNGWIGETELGDLERAFERPSAKIPEYMKDLMEKLIAAKKST